MWQYTHTNHTTLFTYYLSFVTFYEHVFALNRKQIRRNLDNFYSPNTKRELYFSLPPKPTIIGWEYIFCLLWQWTGELVSNKTVVSTATTSEIASVNNFDYSFESWKVVVFLHEPKHIYRGFRKKKITEEGKLEWKCTLYTTKIHPLYFVLYVLYPFRLNVDKKFHLSSPKTALSYFPFLFTTYLPIILPQNLNFPPSVLFTYFYLLLHPFSWFLLSNSTIAMHQSLH